MMPNFRKDLPKGHEGERTVHQMHSVLLIRTDGKEGDFIFVPDGKILELKSEVSYSATDPDGDAARAFREAMSIKTPPKSWRQTDNLFVEQYSSKEAGTPGGPWQAQEHNAEYYVHFFPGDGAIFAYRTDDVVAFMEKRMGRYRPVNVHNPGYTTVGFPVPRAHLASREIRGMFPAWVVG